MVLWYFKVNKTSALREYSTKNTQNQPASINNLNPIENVRFGKFSYFPYKCGDEKRYIAGLI